MTAGGTRGVKLRVHFDDDGRGDERQEAGEVGERWSPVSPP